MLLSDTSVYDVKSVKIVGPHLFEKTAMHTVILTKHNLDTIELTLYAKDRETPVRVKKVDIDE